MTKDETVKGILALIDRCEASAEECNDCVMCHYCVGIYTGDWTVPPITLQKKDE